MRWHKISFQMKAQQNQNNKLLTNPSIRWHDTDKCIWQKKATKNSALPHPSTSPTTDFYQGSLWKSYNWPLSPFCSRKPRDGQHSTQYLRRSRSAPVCAGGCQAPLSFSGSPVPSQPRLCAQVNVLPGSLRPTRPANTIWGRGAGKVAPLLLPSAPPGKQSTERETCWVGVSVPQKKKKKGPNKCSY